MIPGSLSKPSPSATRPPHRGEKAKYTTRFDLRSALLSLELSLKLSLPAPKTSFETTARAPADRILEGGGSLNRCGVRQVLEQGLFAATDSAGNFSTIVRSRRRSAAARPRSSRQRYAPVYATASRDLAIAFTCGSSRWRFRSLSWRTDHVSAP